MLHRPAGAGPIHHGASMSQNPIEMIDSVTYYIQHKTGRQYAGSAKTIPSRDEAVAMLGELVPLATELLRDVDLSPLRTLQDAEASVRPPIRSGVMQEVTLSTTQWQEAARRVHEIFKLLRAKVQERERDEILDLDQIAAMMHLVK